MARVKFTDWEHWHRSLAASKRGTAPVLDIATEIRSNNKLRVRVMSSIGSNTSIGASEGFGTSTTKILGTVADEGPFELLKAQRAALVEEASDQIDDLSAQGCTFPHDSPLGAESNFENREATHHESAAGLQKKKRQTRPCRRV